MEWMEIEIESEEQMEQRLNCSMWHLVFYRRRQNATGTDISYFFFSKKKTKKDFYRLQSEPYRIVNVVKTQPNGTNGTKAEYHSSTFKHLPLGR